MDSQLVEYFLKLKHFCAYRERCHSEVINKCYKIGIPIYQHDELVSMLIDENYLNEQRFAEEFTYGKLMSNHWGFGKIRVHLKQKKIHSNLINRVISNFDQSLYQSIAVKVLEKQLRLGKTNFQAKQYMMSRGFDISLIDSLMA